MSRRALRFANIEALGAALGVRARAALGNLEAKVEPKPNKYHAIATIVDGIRFDSKREARRYEALVKLRAVGEVLFFLRQVPLHLPGGTRLVIDFLVFWRDGRVTWEDAKGRETPAFKIKRREIQHHYPIKVQLV